MVVQNERKEKACCFYVSDFHLEMILVPYITERKNEDITILTEKNLKNTMEILVSKINLKSEDKEKILNLNWAGDKILKDNSNIIVIGTREYINSKNEDLKNINTISVLDCYNFEEEKKEMDEIIKMYNYSLNTLGKSKF